MKSQIFFFKFEDFILQNRRFFYIFAASKPISYDQKET